MLLKDEQHPQHTKDDSRRLRRSSSQGLLGLEDLPKWLVDNEYILTGYRPVSNSFRSSFRSVFLIHNETINIHSHSLGSLIFFLLPFCTHRWLFQPFASVVSKTDVLVFSLYYLGVAICFLLSSVFHIINNHSPRISQWGNQLDYLGIVLLMWGATIPTVYYGFYSDPKLRDTYWATVSILAFTCAIATLQPKFRTPALRPYRAMMYAALGLSAIVFVIHAISIYGLETANRRMSLQWMAVMASFNLTGAVTYALRVPEKWMPERFDIYGSSHQILHVMVIIAGLAHTIGLFKAFRHLHEHR